MDIEILDKGHKYLLPSLDGELQQVLQFVKRCDSVNPKRFPGNTNSYPGCTIQFVIRALVDRLKYLQNQVWAPENIVIIFCLKLIIWCLEFRAGRRHKRLYLHGLKYAVTSNMCRKCGHTGCDCF